MADLTSKFKEICNLVNASLVEPARLYEQGDIVVYLMALIGNATDGCLLKKQNKFLNILGL